MKNNNSGSTIIEVSLIMPIVIAIIVSVIFIFMDVINDAIIQGNGYCGIYLISVGDSEESIENTIYSKINEEIVGVGNVPYLSLESVDGEIAVYIYINKNGDTYTYQGENVCYKREFNKCTQRLRRWQLYGDVLWE
ncbi:MAG: hypothetical protein IJ167_01790 [Lachnospiraceae bacterium]|nr:hypothetical protein [Lachnospiraceae bacterium]